MEEARGLAQGHTANHRLSWEEGPLTSRPGLELPWRAAWEMRRGGWHGDGKEDLCPGAVRVKLGGGVGGAIQANQQLGERCR